MTGLVCTAQMVVHLLSVASWENVSADPGKLQSFRLPGLENNAVGTVYPAGVLEQGGTPLAGVGTGYIGLDPDGRLGKCSIFNRFPAPLALNQPFLFLTVGDRTLTVATPLNNEGDARSCHFFGHFPMADARFELDVPITLELRAFGPFLPGDAVASNTPAILFEVTVSNPSAVAQSVRLTFSPGGFPQGAPESFSVGEWSGIQVTHAPLEGLPGWVKHSYALCAAEGSVAPGERPGVSSGRELRPQERWTARFALTWHQPFLRERSGRVERHIYSERFADAKAVAALACPSAEDWRHRVLAWQDVLYGASLPDWVKETLINAPYALAKNSVWLSRTRPDDWWGPEGLFLVNESFSTCSLTETMPCRFFGHWPALFFFPDLELTTLKAIRHFQLRDGEPPFCMGMDLSIRDPRYHCQHTAGAGEYAEMIYRYYLRTGDEKFLEDFWPSARDSLQFMLSLDQDGDGLVEEHPHNIQGENFPGNNPLDQWPWHGVSSYTGCKGLSALLCGIRMAELMKDRDSAKAWQKSFEKGQRSFEEKLWTGEYYRTYNDPASGQRNDACFSAQLSGVWCARVLGLSDPLPLDRMQKSIDAVARLNMPASPYGMVDAVFADGTPCMEGGGSLGSCWSRDIFIQCNATAAMAFLYLGRREEGEKAGKAMIDAIFRGPHPMPWSQPCGINSQTGGTCHGHDYYDHMVVWSYPLAFAGQDIREACAPGGLIDRVIQASLK